MVFPFAWMETAVTFDREAAVFFASKGPAQRTGPGFTD